MKKSFVLLSALVLFAAVSCDLLSQYSIITIGTSFSKTFDFTIDKVTTIDQEETIDVSTNADLDQYLDKIEDYTIKSINIDVQSFSGNDSALFNGDLKFSPLSSTDKTTIGAITDLNLKDLYDNGTSYDITVDTQVQDALSKELKDNKGLILYLSGSVDKVPVTATVNVTLEVDVKAQAL